MYFTTEESSSLPGLAVENPDEGALDPATNLESMTALKQNDAPGNYKFISTL